MNSSQSKGRLYSFYKAVITVIAFAACFYLFLISFTGTYRLISDIGNVRVIFLNSVWILLPVIAAVLALGIYLFKMQKAAAFFARFEDKDTYSRAMTILKIVIFAECLIFTLAAGGISQRVDQLEIEQAAYSFAWGQTDAFTPPGYLGICPQNTGMSVVIYLLSSVLGHYNNTVLMLINSLMIPFIYSDLSEIGGKFGLSQKSKVLVMICGVLFLPLQAKAMIVYGEIPGLFLAVRAMKHASDIASQKKSIKSTVIVASFIAVACVFKNNFLIYAIAITIYLAAELLRQKRFKELYIPVAVIAAAVLLNPCFNLIVGAFIGRPVSSGESMWSYVAMGMQEEGGMFNGYNAQTYAEAGFDTAVQAQTAKQDIAESLRSFISEPNSGLGFYTRKAMIQWSDPTHCGFEFISRNTYLDTNDSPLAWFMASPKVIRAAASFLKVFQLLMFIGGAAYSVKTARRKEGTPALLLILTFVGGYVFHLIWESAPFYTMAYMALMIPADAAGLIALIKKLSKLDLKKLNNTRIQPSASGMLFFIAGTLVFLFAAAGLGTVKLQLVDGRSEYRTYYNETLSRSRKPVESGIYDLSPASSTDGNSGIKVELSRYAGKYRMRLVNDVYSENIYLTGRDGAVKPDYFSFDDSQEFVILENRDGTYTICHGEAGAMYKDPEDGTIRISDFTDYTFSFDTRAYYDLLKDKPGLTWNLTPAS